MEYLAHYDKEKGEKQLLNEHLCSVAKLAKEKIPPNVVFDDIDNSTVKEIAYWMGYFHDLGKYSNYFQDYLEKGKSSSLKNHAHISACFAYSFLSDYISKLKVNFDSEKTLFFLCYLCIRLHHSSLRRDDLFPYTVWEDLHSLDKHLAGKGGDILKDLSFQNKITLKKFCGYFNTELLEMDKRNFERIPIKFNNGRISDPKWYLLLIYLFSVVIDTDKLDSADIKPKKTITVSPDKVSNYLHNKHGEKPITDLVKRREEARKSMLEVINGLNREEIKDSRFFTLTAPTGIGKTLSSLQCALRLNERIKEIEGYTPRIFTAIPFINIIEQNKGEYERVFGNDVKMIAHHRLSDFSTNKSFQEEIPIDKALLETESWEGDVILTTFVQLFQSMFTGENKLLKKVNKLAGSIVILDEAQAIPEEYMPLIGATLQMFGKYYGTRFILMTATQPKLLEFGNMLLSLENIELNNNKWIELLPNHDKYFRNLNRTKFIPLLDKRLDNKDFIKLFFQKWSYGQSALIVVNTIKRSIEIYNEIKKRIKNEDLDVPFYYLSTNIIPLKRREVIKEVKKLLDNRKPVILVSTQTVEAGVDLDFDIAFRDFGPIDSLIQTAGRVNREGKKGENLPVYIIQLENDNHYVYNLSHRHSTFELLAEKGKIKETEYGELVNRYYELALKRGVSDKSREIWEEGIIKLDFETLKKFKLINEISEVCDVFVEMDSAATDLANAYEEVINYKEEFKYDLSRIFLDSVAKQFGRKINIFERKALLRLIMVKMSDYLVQVRVSRLKENRPIDFNARGNANSNLFWIPPSQLEQYYDMETGFIDESGSSFVH